MLNVSRDNSISASTSGPNPGGPVRTFIGSPRPAGRPRSCETRAGRQAAGHGGLHADVGGPQDRMQAIAADDVGDLGGVREHVLPAERRRHLRRLHDVPAHAGQDAPPGVLDGLHVAEARGHLAVGEVRGDEQRGVGVDASATTCAASGAAPRNASVSSRASGVTPTMWYIAHEPYEASAAPKCFSSSPAGAFRTPASTGTRK